MPELRGQVVGKLPISLFLPFDAIEAIEGERSSSLSLLAEVLLFVDTSAIANFTNHFFRTKNFVEPNFVVEEEKERGQMSLLSTFFRSTLNFTSGENSLFEKTELFILMRNIKTNCGTGTTIVCRENLFYLLFVYFLSVYSSLSLYVVYLCQCTHFTD